MPTAAFPFGPRLRALREAAGLSQTDLASRAGVRQATISEIERGANNPRWDTVVLLADALGVTTEAFRPPRGQK